MVIGYCRQQLKYRLTGHTLLTIPIYVYYMTRHEQATGSVLPRISRLLGGYGANLKRARLRRKFSAEIVAQRAGISRKTLYRIEKGDPAVALGNYARDAGAAPRERPFQAGSGRCIWSRAFEL